MSWFRCDDGLADHPKVMALGELRRPALGLWTMCGTYCSRHLTDGFVSRSVVLMYADRDIKKLTDALVKAGLFIPADGGWVLHDYLDWNPSRAKVLRDRAKKQAAGQAGGQASAQARAQASATPAGSEAPQPRTRTHPVPVPEVLENVLSNGVGAVDWIDPVQLYQERTRRRSVGAKERDWIEDLYVRFSRAELVQAMQATEPGPDYLKRVDALLEGAA